ncbi:hypothetical protein GCM10009817_09180 [Terrabacter lapilli]|uniref:Uncharacterized protein n=1 Tax=Terrabacter lapilli TaxID=436231 RepID=A0ABN2RM07_9MICO
MGGPAAGAGLVGSEDLDLLGADVGGDTDVPVEQDEQRLGPFSSAVDPPTLAVLDMPLAAQTLEMRLRKPTEQW